jgi:hypothetical protein
LTTEISVEKLIGITSGRQHSSTSLLVDEERLAISYTYYAVQCSFLQYTPVSDKMSMSWGNDPITKKPAQEGGPVASVNKRPSKMPSIEIGHLLARRRQQQQLRQPERMAAKLPAALLGVVPESVLSSKRRAESSNSVGATPKRVKGITHPSPPFGSRGFPQAELGNGVENMGSRKNELHVEQSIAHLPSRRTASAARTGALTFRPDERGSMECGAAMSVCS